MRLSFILIAKYGPPDYCGPPVESSTYPLDEAKARLPQLETDPIFVAILGNDHMPAAALLSDDQLSQEFTRYLDVTNATVSPDSDGNYSFSGFVRNTSGTDAQSYAGTITISGDISNVVASAPTPRLCPVCLAASTRIATPTGDTPVTALRPGDLVLTSDGHGGVLSVAITRVGHTDVGVSHHVVHLVLSDGRVVDVSPGHPTADGRTVGVLLAGDRYDGSTVASATLIPYLGLATYDLLPAGPTGTYWANGVLLASTLR